MSEEQIKRAYSVLFTPGSWVEMRALGKYRKFTKSGYYDGADKLAHDAHILDLSGEYKGIYVVLNSINEALHHRAPNMLNKESNPATTADGDITHRDWLPLDFDPKRPAEISASEEEKRLAMERALKVREYLRNQGFPEPILADSGNGAHLLYRIDLPNDIEVRDLIKNFLKALAYNFTDDKVDVDLKMFNAARICKLPGTVTRKGEQSDDRVWRTAQMLEVPEKIEPVPRALIEKEVWAWQQAVEPDDVVSQDRTPGAEFDMAGFLEAHHMTWFGTKTADNGGTMYRLDECPFCHGDGAWVTAYPNGGKDFGCHHNSCEGKKWPALMELFDPDYYKGVAPQSRQEKDQNRRNMPEMPELTLDDVCTFVIKREGQPNEYKKYSFSPDRAADSIIQRFDLVSTKDETIWVYQDGYYTPDGWNRIDMLVDRVAADYYTLHAAKELKRKVFLRTLSEEDPFNKDPFILVCKNCTVDLATGEILEHSPEHYINSPSAFVYDPTAWPEAFLQLLDDSCFNDMDRMTLIDWLVATCCLVSFEFVLFLTGSGSNGKKMYEDVLVAVFPNATEGIGLAELNKEKFAKAQLQYARTNIFNETNVDKAATEIIKSLSGGDMQSGDVKNSRRRARWKSFIQLIFDTNGAPRFTDSSYGFVRRFTRVKMPFTFCEDPDPDPKKFQKQADPTLGKRLIEEKNLSGILNLIIARAPAIIKDRKIARRENDYEEYEEDAHSFTRFCEEFITFDIMRREDPEYRIASTKLYHYFRSYTDLGGAPMSQFSFSRKIGELNKQKSKTIVEGIAPVYRGFKGLKFDADKFNRYQQTEISAILNIPNGSNYSLTSNNEVNTDTVTSITGYKEILIKCRKNKESSIGYKGNKPSFEGVVSQLVTDSDSEIPKSHAATPIEGVQNEFVISAESKKPDEKKRQIARRKLVTLRITADCECDGIQYKKGDVVGVEPEKEKQICGIKIVEFENCVVCGKYMKPFAQSGRGNLCKECFKRGCPQLNGYMHKSMSKGVECKSCGKVIKHSELVSTDGDCEECYYKKLGLSSAGFAEFGCKDGL